MSFGKCDERALDEMRSKVMDSDQRLRAMNEAGVGGMIRAYPAQERRMGPVMESKVWQNTENLTSTGVDWMEWSEKFKNSMEQVRPGARKVIEEMERLASEHMAGECTESGET